MAIDGSFSLHSAVERFLDRFPKLQSFPEFYSLSRKGQLVTEEDVVNTFVGVFLHPSYTIPLMGCFCPIARKFTDKTIDLLRLVPNLRSNVQNTIMEDDFVEVSDEIVNVVEFYSQHGRGLDLHEIACLAFCRALDMAPFLLSSVLNYFKFAPSPFQRVLVKQATPSMWVKTGSHELLVAQISYRFLIMKAEVFSKLWDWSCFMGLLEEPTSISDCVTAEATGLIWCGVQIITIVFKLNYRASENLNIGSEEASKSLLRWEAFCQDTSIEKAGLYYRPVAQHMPGSSDRSMDFSEENCLKSSGLDFQAVSLPKMHGVEPPLRSQRLARWNDKSKSNTFILTSKAKKSFDRVLLAVSQKWPVLLYGPYGSGKSSLIAKLARDSNNQVLSIQMVDQIDARTLVGGYACTDRPGEFRWQPGSLTQAVQNGFWIVFEDIDKAAPDVHSVLTPLLEGTGSFMIGNGEEIRVAEGFRMFSTVATSKLEISQGQGSLSALWRRVMVMPPEKEDLKNIVIAWYPKLELLVDRLIETFERVNSTYRHQIEGSHTGNSASVDCINRFSLRDLLKWCKRLVGLGFSYDGGRVSEYQCYLVYKEAVDVFAAFSTSSKQRLSIMKEISKLWAVPVSAAEALYPRDKPIIQDSVTDLRIGRVSLKYTMKTLQEHLRPFVEINSSLHVLERIACSVKHNEAVLLVGETGTGKTTLVQNLALRLGQKLTVLNLSQQSDVADIIGGYKPMTMNAQFVYFPLHKEFKDLFSSTFSVKENMNFLKQLEKYLTEKKWKMLLKGFRRGVDIFHKSVELERIGSNKKRKKPLDEENIKAWERFSNKLESVCDSDPSSGMMFSFVEGSFITAIRNGEWILLDEVNLAPPETLQRIIGVLEGENGALCLAERGDIGYIRCHPNFRMFACMNPATDSGKRDLPFSLRCRFTEYYIDDVLDDDDLSLFINQFITDGHKDYELVNRIVCFYKTSKEEAGERLMDGANQRPQFSLRSLYRALEYTRKAERKFGFHKALYDGFCMFFLTLLDGPSAEIMKRKILSLLLNSSVPPPHVPFDQYLTSIKSDASLGSYVLTKSVKEHLGTLARAVLVKRYPVLLQGPTSSGKTSLVRYLAALTGHEFVRINNHEHTDLQEYLGSYITDASGRLVFIEGVLVKAVRNGYWIVLDELNLAPSDVLEALNRLLDDNRELFVPELQVTIKAHPNFMLFATQNPPTVYVGRKMLSRAFRNRFIEIHVDEIPDDELSTILEKRCEIPQSYASKMVDVMKELRVHRQTSRISDGKFGFMTPRDLFRWADRYKRFGKSYEDLAKDGYYLLAERLRDANERSLVQEVLEKHLRVKLNRNSIYDQEIFEGKHSFNVRVDSGGSKSFESFHLTKSMQRLYFLVERCYQLREPVLLVGETGGGKTTVCQLLSACLQMKLHILNCHQYTETSDFIGEFRPIRERSRLISNYKEIVQHLKKLKAYTCFPHDLRCVSPDIDHASSTLDLLNGVIRKYKEGQVCCPDVTTDDLYAFEQLKLDLDELHHKWQSIFVWQDGPLVKAMRDGDLFLVDEISLADDSVLERLNSVLEPERKLTLAEKGGHDLEEVSAHPNFFVLATMNPGGDHGKKELSPALRNRFTEIWVSPVGDLDELREIALTRISKLEDASNSFPSDRDKLSSSDIVDAMICFWERFNQLYPDKRMLTLRDLISWIAFFNGMEGSLGPEYAVLHGVFLVLLDGLSLGTDISKDEADEKRELCLSFLLHKLRVDESHLLYSKLSRMGNYNWGEFGTLVGVSHIEDMHRDNVFGIDPFFIRKGCHSCEIGGFEFKAPTTRQNASRVLRAMQLPKPVLLEGSPGVGKTSLIVALGKFSGHKVVRINLCEQTDMMDLLGSDLPVESDEGMKFAWSDGILLQALKEGYWVLLDELNLAPQSVLEGLNAILDHRAEVFIPELGQTYKCPSSFRVFACQNPSRQGDGRKFLPRSFLNRFTKVYVDELDADDYLSICESKFPTIPSSLLSKLILFNKRMHQKFAKDGLTWEFNLRDVFRSCEIIKGSHMHRSKYSFLNIVYIQRMRTAADRHEVLRLFKEVFEVTPFINPYPRIEVKSDNLIVGHASIKRNHVQLSTSSICQLQMLPENRLSLEAAAHCVQHQWLCILIGPSCSGKSSLIRLLANLTGNVLNELNLSSATDISELLGSFEQYDALRTFHSVVSQAEHYISEYCSLLGETSKADFLTKKHLVTRWLAFLPSMKFDSLDASASTCVENWEKIICSLRLLAEIIEELKLNIEKGSPNMSCSIMELDLILKKILKLEVDHGKRLISRKFEWVPGILIEAIERGEWIVLDNANLCNPSVFDRINSLVESSGSITVNERGIVDGNPLVIHPHPNFRMFITVNPTNGVVSRAMRNRGVEIFMMQPYWVLDNVRGYKYDDAEFKDVERFLILSGIPGSQLVNAIAKAHIFAKNEGLHLNVHITYLELSRWIQLFQQLLMNGNSPIWSLQISWEHVYLSSFGEVDGGKIIQFALTTNLSASDISGNDTLGARPICLPGGWPMPLTLRDFMHYSREASIKQNCMYLEFLGAQLASHQYKIAPNRFSSDRWLYLLDMMALHEILFPKVPEVIVSDGRSEAEFDLELANKKLLFAAYWTIEQATESDFNLYLLRFGWFSSQVHPFCQFFQEFLKLLEQMVKHPIWQYILQSGQRGFDLQSMPILSLEIFDLAESNNAWKYLSNSISSIDLLKLTYRQWEIEKQWGIKHKHHFDDEFHSFKSFLESLQEFESEFLSKLACPPTMIVECSSFDYLTELYSDIIEKHSLFWHHLTLSKFDHLVISWRSLVKDARKLLDICPERVEELVMESRGLEKVFSKKRRNLEVFSFSEKSLLWVYGGHPYLPPSCDLHHKQDQLLKFVELLWPTKKASRNQEMLRGQQLEVVASCDRDLRFLVVEGVAMSACMMEKSKEAHQDADIVKELEEMYQMLVRRFEDEKHKLKINTGFNGRAGWGESLDACCSFPPGILFLQSAFCSWLDTLPPVDNAGLHWDMELLQELTSIDLDDLEGLHQAVGRVSNLLNSALNFSLTFSSRPLQMLLPHQKILWILNEWTEVDAVNVKIARFVLELWFRWHQSLWNCFPECIKNFSNIDGLDTIDTALPHTLIEPVNASTVLQITRSMHAIREYRLQCLKFRVTSSNIWRSFNHGAHLPNFLLSAARSLFQQIIYAHKKSFKDDQFSALKSLFCSLQNNRATEEMIVALTALLASTRHCRLKNLVHEYIAPLLRDLYIHSAAAGGSFNSNIGCVWLRIGGLRFRLLLSCMDIDPAMKYSCKYSQLVETISSLEIEIQVRKECGYLAGQLLTGEADKRKAKRLEKLREECRKIQKKIVYRSEPWKHMELMDECADFLKLISSLESMVSRVEAEELPLAVNQACSWQETASCFIDRLTDEYSAFNDIIQPIQVAVFEMKLGLSLILSSALENSYLSRVGQENSNFVMETIYNLVRFPRGALSKLISVKYNSSLYMLPSYRLDSATGFYSVDTGTLERLVTLSSGIAAQKKFSVMHHGAAALQNILIQIAHFVSNSKILDDESYLVLGKIFDKFARLWMTMKVQEKSKSDYDSQQYKFKPRGFQIESVIEVGISTLSNSFTTETFSEWREFSAEEISTEKMEATEACETSVEEWKQLEESILSTVVLIHNKLFGSADLVQIPGSFEVSEEDRLLSFCDSYTLGIDLIRGAQTPHLSSLDAKLMPEHLLYLCLDYERKFLSFHRSATRYNFYKDSYSSEMAKMVEALAPIQQRIFSLLDELQDHNDLQKISDIIDMLLSLPSVTPLAKTFSGLQFLLHKAQVMKESGSKFCFSRELEPVFELLSLWKTLELDSWPGLLDEVMDQYENNAGKLWFPLHSVLQPCSCDQSVVQSLEDFIHTSSIGEYRKRLQLLFAFLGQNHIGASLKEHSCPGWMEHSTYLYNIFGFYVQFLPIVMNYIDMNKKEIEAELKALVKLCRWDCAKSYLSMENLRKSRQKLRKLVQKFTDILQEPVVMFLNQEASQKRANTQSFHGHKFISDVLKNGPFSVDFDLTYFSDENRSIWFGECSKKLYSSLQNFQLKKKEVFDILSPHWKNFGESGSICRPCTGSQHANLSYAERWKAIWDMIENISITAVECSQLWKKESNSQGKRRALSSLLKLLESSGLSPHKSPYWEGHQKPWWFLQHSGDMQHLLLTTSKLPCVISETAAGVQKNKVHEESSVMEWKAAIEHYFKSVVSVLRLQQICLNPHKDITREQVDRSGSFLNQLVQVQQNQLAAANGFDEQLKRLRECVSTLKTLSSLSTSTDNITVYEGFIPKQLTAFKCMWQQKQIVDSLCAVLQEELLMLRTYEKSHLSTCRSVRPSISHMIATIEKFLPVFSRSKESLDYYLIGGTKAITPMTSTSHFCFVTEELEQLVSENFNVVKDFKEHLLVSQKQDLDRSSVREVLIDRFQEIIEKAILVEEEFTSTLKENYVLQDLSEEGSFCKRNSAVLTAGFDEALNSTYEHIEGILQKLCSLSTILMAEECMKITSWKLLFVDFVADLRLDGLCEKVFKTVTFGEKPVNHSDNKIYSYSYAIGSHNRDLYILMDLILNFGDELLKNFLAMHRSVSVTTHVLANVLAALYSKGFGTSTQQLEDDGTGNTSENATGTGMGEGIGSADVSDQITDEDQLLGTREQINNQDDNSEVPSKNDKGIEMEQDFLADAYSISEDSGEDESTDAENEQLDSEMGPTGPNSDAVGERAWDKNEDETLNDTDEKHESGPSIKDRDRSSRELRAKDDFEKADPGKADYDDDQNNETESQDDIGDGETADAVNLEKEAAFADPNGMQPDELEQTSDMDMDMDRMVEEDFMEEGDPEEQDESAEDANQDMKHDEETFLPDEIMEDAHTDVGVSSDEDNPGGDHRENDEANCKDEKKNISEPGSSGLVNEQVAPLELASQANIDSETSSKNIAAAESNWSNSNQSFDNPTLLGGLPSSSMSKMDLNMSDSSNAGGLTENQAKSSFPQYEHSHVQDRLTNPYRSLGDALKEWKERVKVSGDLPADNTEKAGEMEDENAEEYGFVSEVEKGTAQAMGPATSEQTNKNIDGSNKLDQESHTAEKDEELKFEKHSSDIQSTTNSTSIPKSEKREHINVSGLEKSLDEGSVKTNVTESVYLEKHSDDMISLNKSYFNEDIHKLSQLSVDDNNLGKAQDAPGVPNDVKDKATALWRRFELRTTKLSQELSEQLRIVMEPTIASKLQGDYRTGKRINMKKVIPYIASNYVKDKIWLRRTRPNKRDYQVVIAVDDSSSMAESCCGDIVIEALVTVCRAISQLEMGSMAIASFGTKGNIKLLHDFDRPFNTEAGIKMISNLTFEQENTIVHEPILDLLKFLTDKLDSAVARARLPSGHNPLEQLILIISDGQFHEKDNLKRWIRDLSTGNRMVAFLVLDNSQDSIMDRTEVTFDRNGKMKLSKYMESFPFPYYVVLRNIEALPRTLANLLRQWMELLQKSRG